MPKLPSVEQLGARPTPSVQGRVSPLRLETANLTHEGAAQAELGQALAGVGDSLAKLAIKEKTELDATRKREAVTTYSQALDEFEYGEGGFTKILSGDAATQDLVGTYREKRAKKREEIRDSLGNEQQQKGFDAEADAADLQFDGRLYRHTAGQQQTYKEITYKTGLDTAINSASKNYMQPGALALNILQIDELSNTRARQLGLDPSRPEDNVVIESLIRENRTKLHSAVMEVMMSKGEDAAARAHFTKVYSELTQGARAEYGIKTKTANDDGEAMRIVDQIAAKFIPDDPNAPVDSAGADAAIRGLSKDPKVIDSARKEFYARSRAHNDTQQEFNFSNNAEVLNYYMGGKMLKEIMLTKEWRALPGSERAQLEQYITQRGYTKKQHEEFDRQYEDGRMAREAWPLYFNLSDPRKLANMSQAEIWKLEPKLGRKLTMDLLNDRRKLEEPKNRQSAQLDDDMFNAAAAKAGLEPYESKKSEAHKEMLGRLKNEIKMTIDLTQQAKGNVELGPEEKQKLIDETLGRTVRQRGFWKDKVVPAITVPSDKRAGVYERFEKIPPKWIDGFLNTMRSEGKVPLTWANPRILGAYPKELFEHAYGLRQTGASKREMLDVFEVKR